MMLIEYDEICMYKIEISLKRSMERSIIKNIINQKFKNFSSIHLEARKKIVKEMQREQTEDK